MRLSGHVNLGGIHATGADAMAKTTKHTKTTAKKKTATKTVAKKPAASKKKQTQSDMPKPKKLGKLKGGLRAYWRARGVKP